MKLEHGQTILFTGDSITDCGRARPIGEGAGLGGGYVTAVGRHLADRYAERGIRVLNTGVSGNTVSDLAARWQRDVLDPGPDWLSVLIGINDVWRFADGNLGGVPVDLYEDTYRTLVRSARSGLTGLVLMTPYVIEPDRSDRMRALMDKYGGVVGCLAADFDAVLVDLQAAYDEYILEHPSESLSSDRVHPNPAGHMIIARAFLTSVGFDWDAADGPN